MQDQTNFQRQEAGSTMKERPILFSAPMVRAILDGRKNQTRRVVKFAPSSGYIKEPGGHRRWHRDDAEAVVACPYGQPGDRLWVRENYLISAWMKTYANIKYLADSHEKTFVREYLQGKISEPVKVNTIRPSIFMPRWASRIIIEITRIRIERLQDISEYDAYSEGVSYTGPFPNAVLSGFLPRPENLARIEFENLWKSINDVESWHANPLVWVVEFKRVDK